MEKRTIYTMLMSISGFICGLNLMDLNLLALISGIVALVFLYLLIKRTF